MIARVAKQNTARRRRFPPETLTDAEVRALLDSCRTTSASGIRNRALIAILYRTGLRISEALDLYPKDVDLERGAIRVLNGKGGKSRVVGVDRGALAILDYAARFPRRARTWRRKNEPSRCRSSSTGNTAITSASVSDGDHPFSPPDRCPPSSRVPRPRPERGRRFTTRP